MSPETIPHEIAAQTGSRTATRDVTGATRPAAERLPCTTTWQTPGGRTGISPRPARLVSAWARVSAAGPAGSMSRSELMASGPCRRICHARATDSVTYARCSSRSCQAETGFVGMAARAVAEFHGPSPGCPLPQRSSRAFSCAEIAGSFPMMNMP